MVEWLERHRVDPISVRIDRDGAQVTIAIEDLLRLEPEPREMRSGTGPFWVARIEGVQVIGVAAGR